MFTVKEKYKNCVVTCNKFTVQLKNATQEQLEHLYHLGNKEVEASAKKVKNKRLDNAEGQPLPELPKE